MADRLIERGVDNRLSPRLAVSRRQFGHAEGTASNLLKRGAGGCEEQIRAEFNVPKGDR